MYNKSNNYIIIRVFKLHIISLQIKHYILLVANSFFQTFIGARIGAVRACSTNKNLILQ